MFFNGPRRSDQRPTKQDDMAELLQKDMKIKENA